MIKRIVILGGGTGGTLAANRLARELGDTAAITVVDRDNNHIYQPGLLFVPFGLTRPDKIVRPRARQLRPGIGYHQSAVDRVDIERREVHLEAGTVLPYDVLVVASGAALLPGETEGLPEAIAQARAFSFYEPAGAAALSDRLARFDGGRIAINVVDMPIKCPVAPPGLGDALGFVPGDERTLQSKASPDIFVIGDAADLRASKAGSVAHFEGEVLVRNVCSFLTGQPLGASFDGHTNCFIESGFGKALLIDFNYETEPVTGRFPGPVGLPLLKESRLNHLGKLGFQQFYWHMLLPGRDVPGLAASMPRSGKRLPSAAEPRPAG